MNERIKQLLGQAHDQAVPETWTTLSSEQLEKVYDKFAELIVRECIAKVEMRKKFAIEDQHIVDHAFNLLVYDLESHFGVEE